MREYKSAEGVALVKYQGQYNKSGADDKPRLKIQLDVCARYEAQNDEILHQIYFLLAKDLNLILHLIANKSSTFYN